jgi:hypothetical protein
MYYVMKGKHWIGIIETNYRWAIAYWIPRGYRLEAHHG